MRLYLKIRWQKFITQLISLFATQADEEFQASLIEAINQFFQTQKKV